LPTLPLVLGVTDGILDALTLAAGAIVREGGTGVTVILAVRVGIASLITAAFTMFVSDYSERRRRLVRAAEQLSLTEPGHFAASRLGRDVIRESLWATTVAAIFSFVAALLPLLLGALLPGPSWIILIAAVLALGLLGWVLGGLMQGNRLRWTGLMLLGGAVVTVIGIQLHIT
jgi:predicted membrane protein (TIGR00267 family)